jgi:hypothetical protein
MRTFALIFLLVAGAFMATAQGLTGKWAGSMTPAGDDPSTAYLVIQQAGSEITGTGGPTQTEQWPNLKGKVAEGKIALEVTSPDGVVYKCALVLDGDHLRGDVTASANGQSMLGKLDLTRVK